jgi:HAD superfamily hydrolase (TIGR01509 family)
LIQSQFSPMERVIVQLKAVIFDMDGLMLDTEPIYRMACQTAVAELGYTISDELYLTFIGRKDTECEAILRQMWGDAFPIAQCRERVAQLWQHHVQTQGIAFKPGLFELLSLLEEQYILKAVATSTERQQALHCLGTLADRFAAIVTGDEVQRGKPAPDIFLLAAERLQVAPEDCLVLEDSETGIAAAHAANMIAIMVPDLKQPQSPTFHVCPSLLDVRELLLQ